MTIPTDTLPNTVWARASDLHTARSQARMEMKRLREASVRELYSCDIGEPRPGEVEAATRAAQERFKDYKWTTYDPDIRMEPGVFPEDSEMVAHILPAPSRSGDES